MAAIALGTSSLLLGGLLAQAPAAQAYELSGFEGTVLRADGETYADRAGERPDVGIVDFGIKTATPTPPARFSEPIGVTKSVHVDTPPGLVPNPAAIPTCTDAQLDRLAEQPTGPGFEAVTDGCPPESQVGVQILTVRTNILGVIQGTTKTQLPLYNMTRTKDQVARFAFLPAMSPGSSLLFKPDGSGPADLSRVDLIGSVRSSGDYGVSFDIKTPADTPLIHTRQLFWGTPGASEHDVDRNYACTWLGSDDEVTDPDGNPIPDGFVTLGCSRNGYFFDPALPLPDGAPEPIAVADKTTAFLSNPTLCGGPLTTRLQTESYEGETTDASFDTPYGALDCGAVPFAPTVSLGADGPVRPDSGVPLHVNVHVPQSQDSNDRATAHVKDVSVSLPAGFSIDPSIATGLDVCTDGQLGRGSDDPVACPDAAKVGRFTIATPVLDDPLEGSIYVGQPQPGNRYRLFLVAEGRGVSIRLQGDVAADPKTGQLTTTFRDNPQLPFSDLDLHFAGGDRAIIASPQTCGTKTGSASLTSYASSTPVNATASLEVTGCDGFPFSPGFGVTRGSSQSGAFAPLSVAFSRADGNQFLSGLSVKLPEGMTAKLKGVQRCAEAQIAAEACPGGSQIGTVSVQAGTGGSPYPLSGPVYLTDGYKGSSFGTVAIIHAVAGPYDLGNVVVRQALRIDPETAQVTVDSDPLPQIVEGIPLRLRALTLHVSRAGFIRNPTSCGTGYLGATLSSPSGAVASPSEKLAFSGCKDLKFAPQIKLALGNKTQTGKGKNPQFTATVTQQDGEAGLKATSVALPKALALAADNAQALCETADALADRCPKTSIVGSAVAETPILDKALKGPVYFVKGERKDPKTGNVIKTLPTLFVPLRGETTINLRATTSVNHDRLVTTFPAIPDQPITKFSLKIDGGKHGIIAATRSLCGGKLAGSVRFTGQNGAKPAAAKPAIGTACGSAKASARK